MKDVFKKLFPFVLLIFLLSAIPLTLYLVQKPQQTRIKAAGDAPTTPKIAGLVLPSILGFQSDAFTGTSTISYPVSLPSGVGGLKPNLAFSYSSGGVDDMRAGIQNWEFKYPAQASIVGLGWHLGGTDNITAGTDGRFFATIGGASYELVNEAYDPVGKPLTNIWHTNPESYIKIEHTIQNAYGWNNLNQWFITTKDGTKYTFGSPLVPSGYTDESDPATGYTIQDDLDARVSKRIGYKWMVKRIEDTHGNAVDFHYDQEVVAIAGVSDGSGCQGNFDPPENHQFVKNLTPKLITWNGGHNTVELLYEPRTDTDIDNPDTSCPKAQKYFTNKRLKEVLVKVDNNLLRKYTLTYQYAQNRPNHSLLTNISQLGTDGATFLPPYTFEYHQDLIASGNAVYLKTANNGYNGKVNYEYRFGGILFCNQQNACGPGPSSYQRLRVVKKTAEDGMGNSFVTSTSYKEDAEPNIEGGLAFGNVTNFGWPTFPPGVTPPPDQPPQVTNFEFLGHAWTKETLFEKNLPNQKVTVSKSYFYQKDSVQLDEKTYYFVDPRKGRAHTGEVLDPQDETRVLSKSQSQLEYNPKPTFNPVDGKMNRDYHPFVALYGTDNYLENKHTRTSYAYDSFGNQNVISGDGDVDKTGDEQRSETIYIYNTEKWIVGKPLLVKQFRKKPGQITFTEFSHTGYYYDNFDNPTWGQPPTKGDVVLVDNVGLADGINPEIHIQTKTKYNSFGNPIEVYDAKDNKTTTEYDSTYHLFPTKVTNSLNQFVTTDYDFLLGVPTRVVDINGVETKFEYDNLGRAKKIVKIGDSTNQPSVEYIFKDNDPAAGTPMVVGTKTRIESGTDQIMEAYQFYNGLGQLIQEQSYGPNPGQIIVSNTVYNSRGAVVEKPIPYYQTATIGIYQIPLSTLKTVTEYDALNRVIKVRNTDNTFATTNYSGFTKTVANEASINKVFENDAYGNLLKVQEFNNPGSSAPIYATTAYEYDLALGVLTKVTDTKGNITTISYDNFGRKKEMNDPDLGRWQYVKYDANSNLEEQIDAKNQKITFQYDILNRLVKKTYPDTTSVTYQYDQYDTYPDHPQYGRGKRTAMIDPSGSTSTFYDQHGRVYEETKTINVNSQSNTFVTHYGYDNLDRVKTITYPDNEQIQYSYNRAGQPLGLSIVGGSQLVTNTTYSALGQIKKQDYGNNTFTEYKYYIGEEGDPTSLRLKSINTIKPGAPGNTIFSKTYTYDPVGNITSISGPDETENFTYDKLNRLLGAITAYQASYTYDEIGNILTKAEGPDSRTLDYRPTSSTSPWKPVHAPQKVTANGISTQYIYDYNGNLIKDELREIVYDFENRPVEMRVLGDITTPTPTITPAATPSPPPPTGVLTPTPTPTITPTRGPLLCDFDNNGAVTGADLDLLKADYNPTQQVTNKMTDVNKDNYVNALDYSICVIRLTTPTP